MNTKAPEKQCLHCGRPLHGGRSDRRFCIDACRNAFNRNKAALAKQQAHDNLPEIFKIIKKNYEILQGYHLDHLDESTNLSVTREELEKLGFNFKFFTSQAADPAGQLFNCCFDLGWMKEPQSNLIYLAYFLEQAEVW